MAGDSIYRSDAARQEIEAFYDRSRDQLPFPTTSHLIRTRFGETHLLEAGPGDGAPLVVFQGGNVVNPLTLAWFAGLAARWRILAPDTIGQPGKSADLPVSANDSSLGEWAVDVLDGLHLDAAPVIGISYGGGVVLRLAGLAPERIERAILVVPAGIADVPLSSMLALAAGYLGYRLARRPSFVEGTVRRLSGGDPDPRFVESTALAFRGTALDTEMPRNATPEELRGLTAPVMVLAGELDPLFPADRILPRSRAVFPNLTSAESLAGCAHILGPQCVDRLVERVEPFLRAWH